MATSRPIFARALQPIVGKLHDSGDESRVATRRGMTYPIRLREDIEGSELASTLYSSNFHYLRHERLPDKNTTPTPKCCGLQRPRLPPLANQLNGSLSPPIGYLNTETNLIIIINSAQDHFQLLYLTSRIAQRAPLQLCKPFNTIMMLRALTFVAAIVTVQVASASNNTATTTNATVCNMLPTPALLTFSFALAPTEPPINSSKPVAYKSCETVEYLEHGVMYYITVKSDAIAEIITNAPVTLQPEPRRNIVAVNPKAGSVLGILNPKLQHIKNVQVSGSEAGVYLANFCVGVRQTAVQISYVRDKETPVAYATPTLGQVVPKDLSGTDIAGQHVWQWHFDRLHMESTARPSDAKLAIIETEPTPEWASKDYLIACVGMKGSKEFPMEVVSKPVAFRNLSGALGSAVAGLTWAIAGAAAIMASQRR